jgi:PAS domain S-box-containing protein
MTAPAKINTPTSPLHSDEAHARIIKVLEATTDVVAMTDRSGQLLYMNVAGRRLFGWTEDDSVELRNVKEMHPAWAYEVVQHDAFPSALRDSSWSGETALLAQNGQEVPILQVVLAHTSADGEVDFYSTICRDISERKQKELEQIEWTNRYDAAIRASGQVLFDWDAGTGDINYGGDVEGLFGRSDEEMHGGLTRMRQMIHPDDLPAFDAEIERVIATREPFHNEFRFQRKDGSEVLVQAQGFFFLDRQGRIGRMVGFIKDMGLM